MKKLISPLPVGKIPLYKNDLTISQDEIYKSIEAIFEGTASTAFVISGMTATDNGGGNVTIDPGVCWIDGEILSFGGYTGAYPVYIYKGTPIISTKIFFNGSTQNVYEEQIPASTTSVPGSGQFITFNYDTVERFKNYLNTSAQDIADIRSAWVTQTYSGSDFTGNGSAVFVSGSCRYKLIGKTLHGELYLNFTSGTNSNNITIRIPANKTFTGISETCHFFRYDSGGSQGFIRADNNATNYFTMNIFPQANFPNGTNTFIIGAFTIEVA